MSVDGRVSCMLFAVLCRVLPSVFLFVAIVVSLFDCLLFAIVCLLLYLCV